eukprot:TRINITY_DN31126_c0_g1_i1.p1 TRINITY_DN31126_c0_g1~~TRINITY_DN31126_c0_g1_i1.p1  ORF type:complete len:668 (+),score=103.37 TRINITY_DN31126_c0_g1_i1:162-2006(+)
MRNPDEDEWDKGSTAEKSSEKMNADVAPDDLDDGADDDPTPAGDKRAESEETGKPATGKRLSKKDNKEEQFGNVGKRMSAGKGNGIGKKDAQTQTSDVKLGQKRLNTKSGRRQSKDFDEEETDEVEEEGDAVEETRRVARRPNRLPNLPARDVRRKSAYSTKSRAPEPDFEDEDTSDSELDDDDDDTVSEDEDEEYERIQMRRAKPKPKANSRVAAKSPKPTPPSRRPSKKDTPTRREITFNDAYSDDDDDEEDDLEAYYPRAVADTPLKKSKSYVSTPASVKKSTISKAATISKATAGPGRSRFGETNTTRLVRSTKKTKSQTVGGKVTSTTQKGTKNMKNTMQGNALKKSAKMNKKDGATGKKKRTKVEPDGHGGFTEEEVDVCWARDLSPMLNQVKSSSSFVEDAEWLPMTGTFMSFVFIVSVIVVYKGQSLYMFIVGFTASSLAAYVGLELTNLYTDWCHMPIVIAAFSGAMAAGITWFFYHIADIVFGAGLGFVFAHEVLMLISLAMDTKSKLFQYFWLFHMVMISLGSFFGHSVDRDKVMTMTAMTAAFSAQFSLTGALYAFGGIAIWRWLSVALWGVLSATGVFYQLRSRAKRKFMEDNAQRQEQEQ